MIGKRAKKKIFLNSPYIDLGARILDKRVVIDVTEGSDGTESSQYTQRREMLTVEIACYIDQLVLLKEEITDIKVFTSDRSLGYLKTRPDLIKNAISPVLKSRTARSATTTKTARRQGSNEQTSSSKATLVELRSNLINTVYDVDNLNQNISMERFSSLKFLTKFNVNQILGPLKIKNIQNLKQTDLELFGEREVFRVTKRTRPKLRKVSNKTRSVTTDALSLPKDTEGIASLENFRNSYFRDVSLGRDPILSFISKDDYMTLEDRLRGSKSINKPRQNKSRLYFKKIVRDRILKAPEEELGFRVVRSKVSNRNRVCRTTFTMTRSRLRKLAAVSGHVNLIFFAFDKKGRRVDSFEQKISPNDLFLTEVNPSLDFDMSSTRSGRGNINTVISNQELQNSYYNLYQKSFSGTQNYMNSIFEKSGRDVLVEPRSRTKLIDGKLKAPTTPEFSKTKTVFQRATSNFKGKEIANTLATSVASLEIEENRLTCSVYAVQDLSTNSTIVTLQNLSEDVYAVLPVKRVALGQRGSDFSPIQILSEGQLINVRKTFVRRNEQREAEISFSFRDDDVEEGVIYEYAAFLYSRSGHKQLSGGRFLERRYNQEGLIQANVTVKPEQSSGNFDDGTSTITRRISFEVELNRLEDDVDKIINSIFGDNRSLFNNDLSAIKDASNLLYGVRVHRIDTLTGEHVFVGSFRGYKQEDSTATASTDIPKVYRATFEDNPPAFSKQIYKFDPYLIPPSQVLDKVYVTLENFVKSNIGSRTTIGKTLNAKNKILNQDIISQLGTKIASIQSTRGAIKTPESILSENRNDLFVEGLTGDLVYVNVPSLSDKLTSSNIDLSRSSVGLIKTLDRDARNKNYVPKRLAEIRFETPGSDALMDFYIVVKQFNKDPDITIDGCIHSKDIQTNNNQTNKYSYLSEVKTRVGLIRYYLFGVTKMGTLAGPAALGSIVLEGE